jgi:hypothetical protein
MIAAIIRRLRESCPVYDRRVSGLAKFEADRENLQLDIPAIYVVPSEDKAEPNDSSTYRQMVTDSVMVVLVLSAKEDRRGEVAASGVFIHRRLLLHALAGWPPDDDHSPMEYEGGSVLHVDRARLFYGFTFSATMTLTEADTAYRDHADLPDFTGADLWLVEPGTTDKPETPPDLRIDLQE